jgi:hypothetical protein
MTYDKLGILNTGCRMKIHGQEVALTWARPANGSMSILNSLQAEKITHIYGRSYIECKELRSRLMI